MARRTSPPAMRLPALRLPGSRAGERLERRARRGEREAFEQLFQRYHQEIYRYCLAILRDREDAEDALQATMTAALRALPGERREIKLKPWLHRIAHNEAISILRARKPGAGAEDAGELALGADVHGELETRERLRTLIADLRSLPERQRGALIMRELNGLSYDELAGALDTSPAAARQTVYEARAALQRLEEGRAMECDAARQAISARDGRRLRGLKLRSHLRSCPDCRAFEAAISRRGADLEALCPPLAAPVAVGLLASVINGSASPSGVAAGGAGGAAAGGAGAGGAAGSAGVAAGGSAGGIAGAGAAGGAAGTGAAAGGGLAGAAAIKGASVVAAITVAAGAAGAGGVIYIPNPLRGGEADAPSREVSTPGPSPADAGAAASGEAGSHPQARREDVASRASGDSTPQNARPRARAGVPRGVAHGKARNGGAGPAAGTPAHDGAAQRENSATAPGQTRSEGNPAKPGDPPGQSGSGQRGAGQSGDRPSAPAQPPGQAKAVDPPGEAGGKARRDDHAGQGVRASRSEREPAATGSAADSGR